MKKLHNITYIKSELHRRHANDGIASKRLKRQFGNPELTTNIDIAEASGAQNHVEDEELVWAAEDSNNASDGESGSESDEDEHCLTLVSTSKNPTRW